MNRRDVLGGLGASALAVSPAVAAQKPHWMSPLLPDGTRDEATLEALPGKQPLIRLSDRPPNYETPIEDFSSAITENDRFFVRYHLADIPDMDALGKWSLTVGGDDAERPLHFENIAELRRSFPETEITAVCQCSGNRRGLFNPHVLGVQWGYGAMGNAVWRGVRLKDVLSKVGVKAGAVEVWVHGMDGPVFPATPAFRKSLPMQKAMAEEVIIAYAMNGQSLPHYNGYPARLIVPGWTATYWMKHLSAIEISSKPQPNFWMQKAYRVPAKVFPVELPFSTQNDESTWPITEMVVNSAIADPLDGARVGRNGFNIQGVAWDRGHGIRQVEVTLDGGQTWKQAVLGKDLGNYAFRSFRFATGELQPGAYTVSARATNNSGETQSPVLTPNPAGYHNNVPQILTVTVA
ncbi:MAG: molybdopterin-dependent oxidoreductase [Acetobacteraceae bacterium]|nr:molybdopterin-dependent oxidoreductase [Acetobacteraceae bacterium]